MKKEDRILTPKEVEALFMKELDNDIVQQQEKLIKEIFEMVYQWGRVGVITDHNAKAYRDLIKDLLFTAAFVRGGDNK